MLTTPSYKQPHIFYAVRIEGWPSPWFKAIEGTKVLEIEKINARAIQTSGPLFASFMQANFNTFEGFLSFADTCGLDWLSTLDFEEPKGDPLFALLIRKFGIPEELGKIERVFIKGKYEVPKHWVKRFYEHGKEDLLTHQSKIKKIYDKAISEEAKKELKKWQKETGEGFYKPDRPDLTMLQKYLEVIDKALRNVYTTIGIGHYEIFGQKRYKTLLARCYSEIVDVVSDGIHLVPCQNCGLLSVLKSNEKYCDRLTEPYCLERTCKEAGPTKAYQESLLANDKKAEYRRECNRFSSELTRLKQKKGEDSADYKKRLKEFEKWRKKAKPAKKERS